MSRIPPFSEIKRRYVDRARPLPHEIETALQNDARPGARAILAAVEKRRFENRSEGQRLRHMFRYEERFWSAGCTRIAGIDEAGMSPLAGPVVAGAVILEPRARIVGVDDSKKLDAPTRERLAREIKKRAIAWSVGIATVEEIDRVNIYYAGLVAMRRALDALATPPDALLIDARKLRSACVPQLAIVHGDERSLSIAAASIVAKTTRDAMMIALDRTLPGYGFAKHKGYGVPEHLAALEALGVSPAHRRSFGPVRRVMGLAPEPIEATPADEDDTGEEATAD